MKRILFTVSVLALTFAALNACGNKKTEKSDSAQNNKQQTVQTQVCDTAIVYMTRNISPESLVRIYEALGVQAKGNVAVKISTGEGGNNNYLKPELIGQLVKNVNGTIVECNTAYPGTRMSTADHWKTIKEHGFLKIAKVDIMDEDGDMHIPVADTTHMKYNIVGNHLKNYDFMINLAHFKGHAMGGFGGVLKNQSIGVASSAGKLYIHSAGKYQEVAKMAEAWDYVDKVLPQDHFCESMAAAAQAVHNYFKQDGRNIVYIDVMNNMSIDCDCDGKPSAPEIADMGILASTDPVALDQACVDLIFNLTNDKNNNTKPLIERINKQHGLHTIDHAAKIGLGTKVYKIVYID